MEVDWSTSLDFAQIFVFLHKDDSRTVSDFFFGWKCRTGTLISIGLVLETNSYGPVTLNPTEMFIVSI